MATNDGVLKEDEMIALFNGKKVSELTHNAHTALKELFGVLENDEVITCERIPGFIKPDFSITYGGRTHYISMKSGASEIVHQENIKKFILFIRQFGVSVQTQKTILYYQYGDGTYNGTGQTRMSYEALRHRLEKKIKQANEELNSNKELIMAVLKRCVFKGTSEEHQEADFIYCGDRDYGVMTSETQIEKHVSRRSWFWFKNLHIGPLHFRPHARYYKKVIKDPEARHKIEFVWPHLSSELNYISSRYDQ